MEVENGTSNSPIQRRNSTNPSLTFELLKDVRFHTRGWFGDLRFALKNYSFGGLFGPPKHFPDRLKMEEDILKTVQKAEADDDDETGSSDAENQGQPQSIVEKFSLLSIIHRLVSKPSMLAIRFLGWALSKIFRSSFSNVHVHNSEIVAEAVSQVEILNKNRKKTALVLLPTHRSHADYLLLSYLFFGLDLPIPSICAGDNLNVFLLGALLSHSGAFFIRRSNQSERYQRVLQEYLSHMCKAGLPIEFFVEGGRSRRGCVGRPKVGLLNIICQMVREGELNDALLIPVSIDYDRVPEGNGFANEVLGGKKKPESLFGTLRAFLEWTFFGKKLGAVYIGFCDKPLSVKSLLLSVSSKGVEEHTHHHLPAINGQIFRGGSTTSLVLKEDNAIAHNVGRVVVNVQRDCALISSGGMYACALLMQCSPKMDMGVINARVECIRRILVDLGHGNRFPNKEQEEEAAGEEIVHNLLLGISHKLSDQTTRVSLRYPAAPVVLRLLPACCQAFHSGHVLLSWLRGMYDVELSQETEEFPPLNLTIEECRDLRELVTPVVLILDAALHCIQENWKYGEIISEEQGILQVRAKLADAPFPELSAPLEIAAAFRACTIQNLLKRTNTRKGKETIVAYKLVFPTSSDHMSIAINSLKQATRCLDEKFNL